MVFLWVSDTHSQLHNACVSDRMMKYVLHRWAPSLDDRSKLMVWCTDVKSGCITSEGSKTPQSQFKKKFRATVPLR